MTDKTKIVLDENNKIDQLIMKILQNADKRQIEEIDSVLRIYTLTNGSSVNENLQSSLMAGLPTSYIPDEHINYLKLSNYVNLIKKMSSEYDLKTPSQTASISPQIIAEIKNLLKTFPLYDLTKPRVNNACTEKLDKIRDVLEIAKNNPYSIVLKGDLLKQECLDYIEGLDNEKLQTLKYVLEEYCSDSKKRDNLDERFTCLLIEQPEAAEYIKIDYILKLDLSTKLTLKKVTQEKYDLIFECAKNQNNPIFEYLQKLPNYYSGSIDDAKEETQNSLQKMYSAQIIKARNDIEELKTLVDKKINELNDTVQ